jgi:hypothetical protein
MFYEFLCCSFSALFPNAIPPFAKQASTLFKSRNVLIYFVYSVFHFTNSISLCFNFLKKLCFHFDIHLLKSLLSFREVKLLLS